MKSHFKVILIALTAVVVFSSCFKIEQVIRFRGQESGTASYIVDLSSMMSMIKSLEGMGGENKEDEGSDKPASSEEVVKSSFGEIKDLLEKIDSVSGVELLSDTANARFGISADFSNMKALNTLLSVLNSEAEDKKDYIYRDFVKHKKNTYEYLEPVDLKANIEKALDLGKAEQGEEDLMGGIDPMMFFGDLTLSNEMIFDGKKVKKVTNTAAQIAEDKHSVRLSMMPFKKGENTSLKNKVTVQ